MRKKVSMVREITGADTYEHSSKMFPAIRHAMLFDMRDVPVSV
jgi:hypothetical protein